MASCCVLQVGCEGSYSQALQLPLMAALVCWGPDTCARHCAQPLRGAGMLKRAACWGPQGPPFMLAWATYSASASSAHCKQRVFMASILLVKILLYLKGCPPKTWTITTKPQFTAVLTQASLCPFVQTSIARIDAITHCY